MLRLTGFCGAFNLERPGLDPLCHVSWWVSPFFDDTSYQLLFLQEMGICMQKRQANVVRWGVTLIRTLEGFSWTLACVTQQHARLSGWIV